MPLERTRTMGAQDVTLCSYESNVSVGATHRLVSPIAGWVERVLIVRQGAHSSTNAVTVTSDQGTLQNETMATGGGQYTVDAFRYAEDNLPVSAGGVITITTAGTPVETSQIALQVVVRRS